ncbi:MAG: hypothetical protein QOJ65_1371, partial [Fimbriimonadaceae bacterium]|nr:hypothetical protein [Fimbriimonadaceae bacterium]
IASRVYWEHEGLNRHTWGSQSVDL